MKLTKAQINVAASVMIVTRGDAENAENLFPVPYH